MNICEKISYGPIPVAGKLYCCEGITISFGKVALMIKTKQGFRLVSLKTGETWTENENAPYGVGYSWKDVTDSYCLQKVK